MAKLSFIISYCVQWSKVVYKVSTVFLCPPKFRRNSYKQHNWIVTVGSSRVERSSVVKNLGTFLDDKLSMNAHINKVCHVSFYYIHNIWPIRKYFSPDSTETLIHAFITSRLDYCNTFRLYGTPQVQMAQNASY